MTKLLLEAERDEFLVRHKKERDKRIADRIKVVLLYDDGWTIDKIAKALFIDTSTIFRHLEDYKSEKRLNPDHKGSKPILTSLESQKLSSHIEGSLYTKVKEIRAHIITAHGKTLSISSVRNWLHNNGFTYKKPKLTPAKPDPEAQKDFIELYEKVLNEASIEGDPVLFGDAVHPSQQTRPAYGWVRKGKEKLIEVTSGRKRVNVMGAFNLEKMSLVYKDYDTINGASAIDFLKKIEASYHNNKRIHLIWDRAGYHISSEVAEYLKTSKIKVHFLPPRSPNLNAIERLWKIMHEHVSNNRVYTKFGDFKKALFEFFDSTLPSIAHLLTSNITDNFRVAQLAK